METFEAGPVIIGSGAIGLAIASELSKNHSDVVVLESQESFGYHTSSRNSEVIHSGVYYTPNSLKSNLCLSGKDKLYSYLKTNHIPYSQCGKLILAAPGEEENLQSLIRNADSLNLKYNVLSSSDVRRKYSYLKSSSAIYIPDTGFFDSHSFMARLENEILQNGGFVSYKSAVSDIHTTSEGYELIVPHQGLKIKTKTVVNSAGLFADRIAAMAGYLNYKIYFYKGEYYKCSKLRNLDCLVYSVPPADQLSLGIHTRNYLDGTVGFGPNAYPVDSVDYSVDESRKEEFLRDIAKYIDVEFGEDDIWVDYAGIRPKINSGGFKADFLIKKEDSDPNKQFVNLIGIESPGLTCSLSIAEYVSGLLK